MRVITLTTDFGHSEYVAQMKGVILGIAPDVRIVDISHDISPQCVIEGAFVLMSSVPHFKDAVHVAVVDPGVGSERAALVFQCRTGILVGPDNGLLAPAAEMLGLEGCFRIEDKAAKFIDEHHEISHTFHGRDIFAPVAARLAQGEIEPSDVGCAVDRYIKLDIMGSKTTDKGTSGTILRVDRFGNILTNIKPSAINAGLHEKFDVIIGKKKFAARFVRTYSDADTDELIVLKSSAGLLELSINGASAAEKINSKPGQKVCIERSFSVSKMGRRPGLSRKKN